MKKYILVLASASLMFSSCGEESKESLDTSAVSLSTNEIVSGSEGGNFDVTVTSSEDWRISGISDWVSTDKTGGKSGEKVTFKVEPSSSMVSDSVYFKIFAGSAVQKVKVKIAAGQVISLESDDKVELSSDANAIVVKLKTNIENLEYDFTDGGADWISFDQRSDAFGFTTLRFNVKRSKSFTSRTSDIVLKGLNGKDIKINVTQAQRDTILCDNPAIVKGLDADNAIKLVLRSNVTPFIDFESSWLTKVSETPGSKAADGLTDYTYVFSAPESKGSRVAVLNCHKDNADGIIMRQFSIKQQNPHPILVNITDANLRKELSKQGWILTSGESTECEVVDAGLTSTTLTLSGEYYYGLQATVIDGLGGFPELTELILDKSRTVRTIDLTGCNKLKTVLAKTYSMLENVIFADSPVETFSLGDPSDSGLDSKSLTISGSKIKSIDVTCNSWMIAYGYEKCESLDVSGCPALTTLKAKREASSYNGAQCTMKTIYVSAAQKAAIEAGTITVEKSDLSSYVVK